MKTIFKFKTYSEGIRDYYIVSGKEKEIWMRLSIIKLVFVSLIWYLWEYIAVISILIIVLPREILDSIYSSGWILYACYAIIFLICEIVPTVVRVRSYYKKNSQIAFEEVVDGKLIKYKRAFFLPYKSFFPNFLSLIPTGNPVTFPLTIADRQWYYTIGINENNEMKCKCDACGEIFSITNNTLYTLCPHCNTQNQILFLTDSY